MSHRPCALLRSLRLIAIGWLVWLSGTLPILVAADYPPVSWTGRETLGGRNIQRTMRLLATSTPAARKTVRILVYGQSITDQGWPDSGWVRQVQQDLAARFPHANLVVENRALAGFASQLLVKTAWTDLYPFQPDLLIFHVYGAHNTYEDIIRRTRELTSAEILIQTDHVTKPADFDEETDPAKLPPAGHHWDAFMNHNLLPHVARTYNAEICDQRTVWKAYLQRHQLQPQQLLSDAVHLNAHGEWLMAQCVSRALEYRPELGPSIAEDWVREYRVGEDCHWRNGRLELDVTGHRVELVLSDSAKEPVTVQIDGRAPSSFPELYQLTRACTTPPGKWLIKWPIVAPVELGPLDRQREDWTLSCTRDGDASDVVRFSLRGSRTGDDGAGRSDQPFVSTSGRIRLAPEDWNTKYAFLLSGQGEIASQFTVNWSVMPQFRDRVEVAGPDAIPAAGPGIERAVIIASGLVDSEQDTGDTTESSAAAPRRSGGRHRLELTGQPATSPVSLIRVYSAGGR